MNAVLQLGAKLCGVPVCYAKHGLEDYKQEEWYQMLASICSEL